MGATAAGSSLPMDALPAGLQQGFSLHPQLYVLEALLVLASAYAAAAWPDRPRGWCLSALVAVSFLEWAKAWTCGWQACVARWLGSGSMPRPAAIWRNLPTPFF